MQLFFVYDTSFCKSERDDPSDAILYFYPPQVLDPQRCTICCQLAGTVQFFQSTFSCPKIITLQKGKFAIKCCSRYLLALEANSAVPDVVVIKQLENLYNIYCFYHKDIDRVCKLYSNNRSEFLQRMEEIWKCCFSVACGFNNDVLVAFDAVPTIAIPEAVSVYINIQALQLLQSCQSYPGIIAGCILFKHQILVTQFNSEISRFLMLVRFLQESFSAEDIPLPFQLPPGVCIVKVFIQKSKLYNIACANSYYGKHSGFDFEKSNNYLFNEISSGSEGDIDSDIDSESLSQNSSINVIKVRQIHKSKNFRSSMRRKHSTESQTFSSGAKSDKSGQQKRSDLTYSAVKYKYSDTEHALGQSMWQHGIASGVRERTANVNAKDLHVKTQHAGTSKSDGDNCDTDDTLQEMCLFIQSYLNSIVIFLVEPKFIENIDLIKDVWNSGLSVLSELEVSMQCHMQEVSKEKPKNYMFLCLENQGRSLNGFPSPDSFDKQHHQPVFKTMQHIHGDFETNPCLLDISTISSNTMIHACRSPIHEAFYHQEKQETDTLSSYFNSLGSLPAKAVRRLEKSLGIFLP